MARSTLARHRTVSTRQLFLRDRTDGGGGGGAGSGTETGNNGGSGSGSGSGAGSGSGSDDAGSSGGTGGANSGTGGDGDKGFPEGTPLEQMTVEQQRNYWKHYARHHEQRANQRADYDQQKADAEKWREAQRSQMTPDQRAIEEAREAGRAEAAAAAATDQVQNLLRVALGGRGVTGEALDELVAAANPSAFITDGKVVADKVTSYAARIAPATGQTGGGQNGQQQNGQQQRHGAGGHRGTGAGKPDVTDTRNAMERALGRRPKSSTGA